MESQPVQVSPSASPTKKLNFSVDSLLSRNKIEGKTSTITEQKEELLDQTSDTSGRSSPGSDISVDQSSATDAVSLSMAAAAQQRANFVRHTAAQLPHSAFLYPWLMSANLMTSPPVSLISSTAQQQSSK